MKGVQWRIWIGRITGKSEAEEGGRATSQRVGPLVSWESPHRGSAGEPLKNLSTPYTQELLVLVISQNHGLWSQLKAALMTPTFVRS